MGIPGTYALHARRAGVMGLVGAVLIFFSALIPLFFSLFAALVIPYTVDKAPDIFKSTSAPPVAIIVFTIVLSLTVIVGLALLAIPMLRRQASESSSSWQRSSACSASRPALQITTLSPQS